MESIDHQAFRAFARNFGIDLMFSRASVPAWIGDDVLIVPDRFTPEQQGNLGAMLARRVISKEEAA